MILFPLDCSPIPYTTNSATCSQTFAICLTHLTYLSRFQFFWVKFGSGLYLCWPDLQQGNRGGLLRPKRSRRDAGARNRHQLAGEARPGDGLRPAGGTSLALTGIGKKAENRVNYGHESCKHRKSAAISPDLDQGVA